jgi:hypothetical protein
MVFRKARVGPVDPLRLMESALLGEETRRGGPLERDDFPTEGEEFPMQRMIPVGLALIGMAIPAAAMAGSPGMFGKRHKETPVKVPIAPPPQFVQMEDGTIVQPVRPAAVDHVHNAGVPCATCEAAAAPTVVMEGTCAACESGSAVAHPHPLAAEAPGLASLRPQEAPGYARIGDGAVSQPAFAEPTPIGVMQAGYRPQGQQGQYQPPGQQGPVDVLALSEARAKQKQQAGNVPATMGGSPGKPRKRPHILAHLFGLDPLYRIGREREARRTSQHAAIAYGESNQIVTDVPASAVYGNGGH